MLAHAVRVAEVLAGTAPPIPGDQIPEDLLVYSDQIGADLHDASTRVLQVMRWRLNLRGRHNPIRATKGSYFSSDNGTWHPLPMSSQVSVDSFTKPDITPAVLLQLDAMLREEANEPIAHVLLREAWEQRDRNPRSAILLGVSAVEVGIKSCIAQLLPQTAWLLENMPSPSVEKLLSDYVPTLPARMDGQPVVIPKAVLDQMKKAVQIRNQLAHAGHPKIDGDFLHEMLRQARQLLWLFDAMTGHRWAAAYLKGEGGL